MSDSNECESCASGSSCAGGSCPGAAAVEQDFDQVLEQIELEKQVAAIKHTILVLSGKGGVGKSTVAANLATALASAGKRVGLLDVDIHGPSIPRLLRLEGETLKSDGVKGLPVSAGENLKVVSVGFLLAGSEEAVIWRGPMKYGLIKQFISQIEWGELDYLVVDSPPGTGDEPLSVVQLMGSVDGAVLVTTPQELSTADVRRSISFCRKLNVPVLGVLENMSGFVCPHCNEHTDIFGSGGGETMAEQMGVPFLGRIPIDPRIVQASDDGTPYLAHYATTEAAKAFERAIQPLLDLDDARG